MTKTRLESFSDGVIAIVITLLAFELKVPIKNSLDNFATLNSLFHLLPQFLIFVLSFITISIMWINHHIITSNIEILNRKTIWANSLLLMFISLIPFATTFLAENPFNQVALVVYSLVMLLCSFCFSYFKKFSAKKGRKVKIRERFRHIGIYSYALAIFFAIFFPQASYLFLIIPSLSYLLPQNIK